MKAHLITLAIPDHEGMGASQHVRRLTNLIGAFVTSARTADIGEWSDDHPINFRTPDEAEAARLFPHQESPAAIAIAEYIFDCQSEEESFRDSLSEGVAAEDLVYYRAAIVLGREDSLTDLIAEYADLAVVDDPHNPEPTVRVQEMKAFTQGSGVNIPGRFPGTAVGHPEIASGVSLGGTEQECEHTPDWHTVKVEDDGGDAYIDVNCSKCGLCGCIGKASTLLGGIDW